jgi:protoheme IX farnesyltransferase
MGVARDMVALTKPKITLLNVAAALACYVASGGSPTGIPLLGALGYGAAGGSSVLNNVVDSDVDGMMRRTARRPIPSGRVSRRTALILGAALTSVSVLLASIVFNPLTAAAMLLGALSYVLLYTLYLKRRTDLNIVIGGIAGSFPPLAGAAAASGTFTPVSIAVAALIFLWTPGHFWSLAIRASEDYRSAGLPMMPVTRGVRATALAIAASNALLIVCWLGLTAVLENPVPFLLLTSVPTALLSLETVRLLRRPDASNAWRSFKLSSPWLLLVLIGTVLSSTVR